MTGQYSVLDFNLSVSGPVTQSAAGPNMSSVIIPFHCQYAELTGTHTGQAVAKEVVIDPVRAIAIWSVVMSQGLLRNLCVYVVPY
jgi:hypothetical protein